MSILKELIKLNEAAADAERTFDLDELVTTFKTDAEVSKHGKKLWGTTKLTFNGKPFFNAEGDFTPAFKAILKAAERELGKEVEIDVTMGNDTETYDIGVDNVQEVYTGYDVREKALFIGFDVWLRQDDFENAFEEMYKKEHGKHPEDDDSSEPEWKSFKKNNEMFYGALIQVRKDGQADLAHLEPGGFYKAVYRDKRLMGKGMIDLRLD